MNKNLTEEDLSWIWAVERNKVQEFFSSRYSLTGRKEFTPFVGGIIVGSIFKKNKNLFNKACLEFFNDNHEVFLEYFYKSYKNCKYTAIYTMQDLMNWLLFTTLVPILTPNDLDDYSEQGIIWEYVFLELDNEFSI